ncbi:MAG: copper resistance protein CopC [Edaphobacter sp.]|uniref:copper resistance protein CopC n=1 Tax=Edaphobacter sp. TaxID=1934404 RepID=UPI00239A6DDF|nr:copper resistance protein CopC [Edaphobacter sp.]MDE1175560.1 copper resistance protein CopC [Edaphobacter sp.]
MRRLWPALLLVLCSVCSPSPLRAQGCSQCRDNTASTSPATQRGYRHAILLLTVTASGIFTGAVLMMRRSR